MRARLRTWLRALWRRERWEQDLEDELRFHTEQRADALAKGGMAPAEARRRARLELGARETYKEECRRSFGLRRFDELGQDLRYAFRTLRKSPGFTAVAVLSLALGIGANTVVFSVLNAIVLRALPVAAPDRLVYVQMDERGGSHSYPNYRDLRDRNGSLSGLLATRLTVMGVETDEGPRRIWGYLATGNYFDTLGVKPAVGRFFHAKDDVSPGASPYAVLSFRAWQSRFGSDPAIVGRTVRINRMPFTVLGVAPRGFFGTELFFTPEIWVPMMMQPQIEGRSWLENRNTFDCWVTGRLKPGVTPAQAEADLNRVARQLIREYPQANAGMRVKLAKPGLLGDTLRRPTEAFVSGVMLLAALVLLAACANLASLLGARARDRHFELAVRVSIGAGRGRIFRQLLTESLVLACAGGAAACALAYGVLHAISKAPPPIDFPTQFAVEPDWRVLLFAMVTTVATGLIFGTAPALHAVKADPNGILRGSENGTHKRRFAARDLLLGAQVALCCFLVTACFVSLRGLSRSLETPVGFEPRGLSVAAFDLGLASYTPEEGARFQRRAMEAALQLAGVRGAAFGNSVPLWINQSMTGVYPPDATEFTRKTATPAIYYTVSPGYFAAMGTRLLTGRDFTWHDDRKAPPVAVVNRAFARRVLKKDDASGQRFRYGGDAGDVVQIVGMVEDGKYESLTEEDRPVLFRAAGQSYDDATVLVVRSSLPSENVARQLRDVVASLDGQLPIYALGDIRQLLGVAYFPARAATVALGAFGLLAVMLALTGIYGLAAYTVSRRVREIGIRVAVGAQPLQVLHSVLGRIGVLLLAGSAAGLLLGLASTRVLESVVWQATPQDPAVLAAVALSMFLVGLGAAWIPARRAITVDPVRWLRHD